MFLKATRSVGGGKRDRTADLLHAMQALSQLSYTPMQNGSCASGMTQNRANQLTDLLEERRLYTRPVQPRKHAWDTNARRAGISVARRSSADGQLCWSPYHLRTKAKSRHISRLFRPIRGAIARMQILVPTARLELAQLSPLPPQDSVSTNFTTSAFQYNLGLLDPSPLASWARRVAIVSIRRAFLKTLREDFLKRCANA